MTYLNSVRASWKRAEYAKKIPVSPKTGMARRAAAGALRLLDYPAAFLRPTGNYLLSQRLSILGGANFGAFNGFSLVPVSYEPANIRKPIPINIPGHEVHIQYFDYAGRKIEYFDLRTSILVMPIKSFESQETTYGSYFIGEQQYYYPMTSAKLGLSSSTTEGEDKLYVRSAQYINGASLSVVAQRTMVETIAEVKIDLEGGKSTGSGFVSNPNDTYTLKVNISGQEASIPIEQYPFILTIDGERYIVASKNNLDAVHLLTLDLHAKDHHNVQIEKASLAASTATPISPWGPENFSVFYTEGGLQALRPLASTDGLDNIVEFESEGQMYEVSIEQIKGARSSLDGNGRLRVGLAHYKFAVSMLQDGHKAKIGTFTATPDDQFLIKVGEKEIRLLSFPMQP